MLENRGFRFYTQSLGGLMLIFAVVVVFGFTTTATATKKPCRADDLSPHCHIGNHANQNGQDGDGDGDYNWDLTIEIIYASGDRTTSAEEFPYLVYTVSHANVVDLSFDDLALAQLCFDYGDFSLGPIEEFNKTELFIDVHHHLHEGELAFGDANGDDIEDDHQHDLIASCFEKGNGNGGGNGKGKGRNG